ncbi:PadR family transcriptional regulator [Lactobacillus sp. M0403]|jgi:PadR family transcriptional regulator, regulatory protein PadR|uniref:PadR family transcriptional regulator n=1 Tax=Lactobacillus TaxID=1578 RepID=UPI000D6D1C25|nr:MULTISPECIES: PadR family transcriptional regulator [Lactobacillus]AWM73085.1 PadR family transcriptional regulator [Lactobacillus apis]MBC6361889.1 PadR family transcriptional regulator [Lactobacillus apis]MBH9986349.1 PadR family transcriptional regulator [Lactobacillus sp. M0390]MBI0093538.1 PadR family transcriptional regulator [Lactobacillus sp. M0403]MCO6529021.1 PadR family transcriptional regulator [Lactobacillus sp.]
MAIQIPTRLLDGAVLAFLKQDDLYGYALTQNVQKVFDISESTIYPVLRRLKKNNYLTTYDEPYQGRNRRYYHITDDGIELLQTIQDEWQGFSTNVDQVLGGQNDQSN